MIETLEQRVLAEIRLRLANGEFSGRGLAVRAGLSQAGVQLVLSGKRRASAEYLGSMATAAGIRWSDMVAMVTGCDADEGRPFVSHRRLRGHVR